MACFEDGCRWRTNAQKEWQEGERHGRGGGLIRNLPVRVERSHGKLAEMEAFHYVNKICPAPRAHSRHTTSRYLCVRLSAQSYLPAHVFHMQLPWSLQIIIPMGGVGNVNNEQHQGFYALSETIIPWRSRAGGVKWIATQPLIVF